MSTWNISKKLKSKIIIEARNLDNNNVRILYLLRNLGPQRFTNLIEHSRLSRSTVSKYLKLNSKGHYIEKRIYKDTVRNIEEQRYFITELGIEKLNEEPIDKDEKLYFNELNRIISELTDLINFYKEIGVEESIIFQIVMRISKIGDNFVLMEQNRELYLSLFYIFLNSVFTRDYKFEIKEFCKYYDVKKLRIDFYVDKIMSNKFGFYMFTRILKRGKNELDEKETDIFFFHEEDILGTMTLRLIKDRLIEEIIYINRKGYRKIYDLDKMAEEISEKLMDMDLIWERIREPFEMLIEKLLIKNALDMGFSKAFLMDIVIQSEKMLKIKEGIKPLMNIIEGSERYEDLNIVSISELKKEKMYDLLEKIQGFCPNCGKTILKQDLSNKCSKCEQQFKSEHLLKSIDAANEASMRFKQETLQKEELIDCPNPECDARVKASWKKCHICGKEIKILDNLKKN